MTTKHWNDQYFNSDIIFIGATHYSHFGVDLQCPIRHDMRRTCQVNWMIIKVTCAWQCHETDWHEVIQCKLLGVSHTHTHEQTHSVLSYKVEWHEGRKITVLTYLHEIWILIKNSIHFTTHMTCIYLCAQCIFKKSSFKQKKRKLNLYDSTSAITGRGERASEKDMIDCMAVFGGKRSIRPTWRATKEHIVIGVDLLRSVIVIFIYLLSWHSYHTFWVNIKRLPVISVSLFSYQRYQRYQRPCFS